MPKEKIEAKNAPAAIGPYSHAIRAGGFVFASGQLPVDPATGKLVEGGIKEQVTQMMKNVQAVLTAADCTFDDVVKTTVFLQDMGDFAAMNEIYAATFAGEVKPARSAFQVAKLPMGAMVEMEVVACK